MYAAHLPQPFTRDASSHTRCARGRNTCASSLRLFSFRFQNFPFSSSVCRLLVAYIVVYPGARGGVAYNYTVRQSFRLIVLLNWPKGGELLIFLDETSGCCGDLIDGHDSRTCEVVRLLLRCIVAIYERRVLRVVDELFFIQLNEKNSFYQ